MPGQPVESVVYELQALRKIYEHLDSEFATFKESSNAELAEIKERQKEHDKILVRGNGEPSLQERFRTMERKLDDFITSYNKAQEKRADDARKLFWVIIGFLVPAGLMFIYQFGVFWVTIVPELQKVSTGVP